jgi:hypothetical protein
MQKIYGEAILAYSESIRSVERMHSLIAEETKKRFRTEDPTPQQYGKILLERYTGKRGDRSGQIYYQKRPGYIVIGCPRREDYGELLKKDTDATIVKESGGVFTFFTLTMNRTTERIPVILIPEEPSHAYRWKGALEHERQHFFHHVALNVFSNIEQGPTNPESQQIKDEVLAYLKQGVEPGLITDILNGPLYDNLFEGMKGSKKKKILYIVKKLIEQIETTLLWNMSNRRAQALLINHLLDIPLLRWHAWLPHLDAFYRNLYRHIPQNIRAYAPCVDPAPGIISLASEFSPQVQQRLHTHEGKMVDLQHRIFAHTLGYAPDHEASASLEDLQAQFERNQTNAPPLSQGAIAPIYAFFPEAERKKTRLTNYSVEEVRNMGSNVIDRLQNEYTQKKRAKIWKALGQKETEVKQTKTDLQTSLYRILIEQAPIITPPTPKDISISSDNNTILIDIRLEDGSVYYINIPL